MNILALEFSSSQRSAAVYRCVPGTTNTDFASALAAIFEKTDPPGTAFDPLGLISSVLRASGLGPGEIDRIAVGLGPGSYTGIRVALAVAQGWALAGGSDHVKFVGLPSTESVVAMAHLHRVRGELTVAIDAQRQELYVARYRLADSGWTETIPLRIIPSAELEAFATGSTVIGPDADKLIPGGVVAHPAAAYTAFRSAREPGTARPEELVPIYLRKPTFRKAPPPRPIPTDL